MKCGDWVQSKYIPNQFGFIYEDKESGELMLEANTAGSYGGKISIDHYYLRGIEDHFEIMRNPGPSELAKKLRTQQRENLEEMKVKHPDLQVNNEEEE